MKLVSATLLILIISLTLGLNSAFGYGEFQPPEVNESQADEAIEKIVPLRFLPGNPLHLLILVKESTTRLIQPSALQKAEFDLTVCGKRLKEAYLLTKKGNMKKASEALDSYSKSQARFNKQIVKARSQNQDVEKLIGASADIYESHEILIYAISQITKGRTLGYDYDTNLFQAVNSLKNNIELIDSIKPGIKNRFKELFEI